MAEEGAVPAVNAGVSGTRAPAGWHGSTGCWRAIRTWWWWGSGRTTGCAARPREDGDEPAANRHRRPRGRSAGAARRHAHPADYGPDYAGRFGALYPRQADSSTCPSSPSCWQGSAASRGSTRPTASIPPPKANAASRQRRPHLEPLVAAEWQDAAAHPAPPRPMAHPLQIPPPMTRSAPTSDPPSGEPTDTESTSTAPTVDTAKVAEHRPDDDFQRIPLQQLAEMEVAERAFLTLYLFGSDALADLEPRVEEVRRVLADDADGSSTSSAASRRCAPGSTTTPSRTPAWSSLPAGHSTSTRLHRAVAPRTPVARLLAVHQAVRRAAGHETFAVVAADNRATRVFLVSSAMAADEERVRGDVKKRVKKGGSSQKRYAVGGRTSCSTTPPRWRRCSPGWRRTRPSNASCSSLRRGHEGYRDALPQRLAERLLEPRRVDLKGGHEDLLVEAFEVYFAGERDDERRLWERIREEALGHGLAPSAPPRRSPPRWPDASRRWRSNATPRSTDALPRVRDGGPRQPTDLRVVRLVVRLPRRPGGRADPQVALDGEAPMSPIRSRPGRSRRRRRPAARLIRSGRISTASRAAAAG